MTTVYISTRRTFEAAHYLPLLPREHKCRRLHGHNYQIEVVLRTAVGADGMMIDYADIDAAVDTLVVDVCDHRLLNDVDGLENPTGEVIAVWAAHRLREALPGLHKVSVWETPRYCATVRATDL